MLEEGVGDHRHERMAMKALPGSALEVIEAEFFFHLLMGLFADPSRLEGATTPTLRITGHLFASLPVPTRFLHGSCPLMPALPGGWRTRLGPGSLVSRRSNCRRVLKWT